MTKTLRSAPAVVASTSSVKAAQILQDKRCGPSVLEDSCHTSELGARSIVASSRVYTEVWHLTVMTCCRCID